jgi:predicted transcriptional regulator
MRIGNFVLAAKAGQCISGEVATLDEFKDRLRAWRGKRYQKQAADILSVSTACIRKWEKGKRTPGKLALAEIERRMADTSNGK